MKKILVLITLLVIVSCKSDKQPAQIIVTSMEVEGAEIAMVGPKPYKNTVMNSEPYELKVQMNMLKNDVYDLMISIKLNDNAHFVSPNAKRDFKGKFTVYIDDNNFLKPTSNLIETPLSVEEIDLHPFVRGTVNWVRVDTNYNLQLQRKVETDFKVKGYIQFTIEPRCTLEKIPIIIKYEDGQMTAIINNC